MPGSRSPARLSWQCHSASQILPVWGSFGIIRASGTPAGACPSVEKRAEEGAVSDSSLPAPQEFISEELLPVFRAAHTTGLCLDRLIPGNLLGLLTCSAAAQPCLGPEFAVVTLNVIVQGMGQGQRGRGVMSFRTS